MLDWVSSSSQTHLTKNSKVEVCSNEEGYKGAWFPAIIVDPTPARKKRKRLSNSHKVLVQYRTILSDDDPEKPLHELVQVRFTRPEPPSDNADAAFVPGDAVDAFNLDAWWPGVVMEFDGDKYTVGFEFPPDLLVLPRSELRAHWDFREGIWARPPRQNITKSIFSPGTSVEVNLHKERLMFAWSPAIYLGQLGTNSFLLQCKSLKNGDVKVVVGRHQIRPQPPQSVKIDFTLLDMVDAFHEKGWWVGQIYKVLTGKQYMVRLSFTNELKEYSHSELRPHLEWLDGEWVSKINGRWTYNSQEGQSSRDYEVRSKHACESFKYSEVATPLESSGASKYDTEEKTPCSRISWKNQTQHFIPCIDKSRDKNTRKKLKISEEPDDDATISSVSKKLKGRFSEDSLSISVLCARRTPTKTSNKEAPVRDGEKTKQQQVGKRDFNAKSSFKRIAKKGGGMKTLDEEDIEDEHVMDNIESFGIRSESEVTGGSHAGKSCLFPMEEVEEQNEDGVTSEVKGRGKLSRLLVEYSKEPATGCMNDIFVLPMITRSDLTGVKNNGNGVVAQVELTETEIVKDKVSENTMLKVETVDSAMDIDSIIKKIIESSSNPAGISNQQNEFSGRQVETGVTGSEEAIRETQTVDSAMDYSVIEVQVAEAGISAKTSAQNQPLSMCMDEMHSVKTIEASSSPVRTTNQQIEVNGRQVETGVTNEIEQHDSPHLLFGSQDAVKEVVEAVDSALVYSNTEVQVAVAGVSIKTSAHEQPFSLCTDEMHSVKTTEGSSNPARIANQQNEVRGTQVEAGVITVIVEQQDGPILPFVKSSPVWKSFESMEVFKRFPQNPHFHPLVKCREVLREGSAIGNMVSFASLVENTSKLHVGDPRDVFDNCLEGLAELEMLGFDVKAVQHRLMELLAMKVRLGQLQDQSKVVDVQIKEHTDDRTKHKDKISAIDKEIKDLQEKRAMLMEMDVVKGSEMSRLKSEAIVITNGIQSIEHDFGKLVSAAW